MRKGGPDAIFTTNNYKALGEGVSGRNPKKYSLFTVIWWLKGY